MGDRPEIGAQVGSLSALRGSGPYGHRTGLSGRTRIGGLGYAGLARRVYAGSTRRIGLSERDP
ncbi:hypothetical protein [Paenibacillus sp. FSL R5-0765]|uniref:hypothetical protein n=1 Tax=Paenibacillus sp. FSL R5-0765 TaxID=1920425 RepID=UPI00117E8A3F|nr:hypothetical protein [Paenibacillus sp. FSL R5-0765]